MRLFNYFCLVALLMPLTVTAVGCGGGGNSEQMATDQELSEYGQAAAPQEWKDALDGMKGEEKKE